MNRLCRLRFFYFAIVLASLSALPSHAGDSDAKDRNAPQREVKPAENTDKEKSDNDKTNNKKSDKDEYELYKLLIDALDQVDRNYVVEVNRREMIESAIRGVLAKLDPYSTYLGPEEVRQFRANIDGEFGGIGIQLAGDDGQLHVLSPIYGTPAYRAGVLAGDRIVAINGKSTDGLTIDDAVKLLQGNIGEAVTLTLVHPNKDTPEKIKIVREKIRLETVLGNRRGEDGVWDFMLDPQQRIGYVRLTAFSTDTAEKLQKVLKQLESQKMRGLILDLRFNPGGLLSAAIETSDLFISEGRIVSTKGRNSPERTWDAHKEGTFSGFPMVVLVNRYSASASEIVAACLQDHGRAVIIGERTWGKGSVQNVIELEGDRGILKLTTAAYRRPSGKNIHRFPDAKATDEWGVMPNKGFDMELDDDETIALIDYRRDRDILRLPPKNGEKTAKPAEVVPEVKKSNGDKNPADGKTIKNTKSKTNSGPFVDRQLQAALKYLRTEAAKTP